MQWQRGAGEIAAVTYDSIWRVYNPDGNLPMDGFGLGVQDTKELLDLKRDVPFSELVGLSALREGQAELGLKPK